MIIEVKNTHCLTFESDIEYGAGYGDGIGDGYGFSTQSTRSGEGAGEGSGSGHNSFFSHSVFICDSDRIYGNHSNINGTGIGCGVSEELKEIDILSIKDYGLDITN